jgi:hypothetical protein
LGLAYENYKAEAAALPKSEAQVQLLLARYCLGTRLNCLTRYLPAASSLPALRAVDELLVAAVAGLAGEASGANLTAAVQGRALLAMRFGGVLPGAEITAHAQHVAALAASAFWSSLEPFWSGRARSQLRFGSYGIKSRQGEQMPPREPSRRSKPTSQPKST